ncbi:MAG: hypothetical protein R6X20_01290 [Phycisphaerae bacterium]
MASRVHTSRICPVLLGGILAVGLSAQAWAWGSGYGSGWGGSGWDGEETDRLRERHRERVTREAEKYAQAFKDVKQEQERAATLLEQGEQKAGVDGKGDEVKAKRGIRLARHKGIKNLLKVDAKYARLFAGIREFKADEGDYFTDETKGKIEILLVQLKDQARANRERIADLYVEVEKPVKALKVLEGIYQSLSVEERASAMDLKARIKALKAQLGIKDDDGSL